MADPSTNLLPWIAGAVVLGGLGWVLYKVLTAPTEDPPEDPVPAEPGSLPSVEDAPYIWKGDHVAFDLRGQTEPLRLPPTDAMFHSPGRERAVVYFGPIRRSRRPARMTREASLYLGDDYGGTIASCPIDLPTVRWEAIGRVAEIYYERHGVHAGRFHHPFRSAQVVLSRHGRYHRLDLGPFAVLNHRGYVFP